MDLEKLISLFVFSLNNSLEFVFFLQCKLDLHYMLLIEEFILAVKVFGLCQEIILIN